MINLIANKPFPYAGKRVAKGQQFAAPDMDARTLVFAGLASQVLDQAQAPKPATGIQSHSPAARQRARRSSDAKPRRARGGRQTSKTTGG